MINLKFFLCGKDVVVFQDAGNILIELKERVGESRLCIRDIHHVGLYQIYQGD